MRFRVSNDFVHILDPLSTEELQKLSDFCSYTVEGARYSPAFQKKQWDGKKRLFSSSNYTFPSGLLPAVLKKGIVSDVEVIDSRCKPPKKFKMDWHFPFPLKDYQVEAVASAIKYQRGVIQSSTGSGKTVIAMKIAQELGVRTLFIVNTKEAFKDTVAAYNKCFKDEPVGMLGAGRKQTFGRFITVATMSWIVKAYERKDRVVKDQGFQCLVIDEVHHVGADTWFKAAQLIDAYYKFGLTGTNFRMGGSKMLLSATTGRTLIEIKTKTLQEKNQLAQCEIYYVEVPEPQYLDRPMEYRELYSNGIVDNDLRNKYVVQLVMKHPEDVKLVTVESVAHGEKLLKMIKKVDKTAVFISGKSKGRDELKDKFVAGEFKTVIATRIYNESADVPILSVTINAAGGKSGIAVVQRLGRQLRLFEGKGTSIQYDFYDSFNYAMEQHSAERIKWLKREGHKVSIVKIKDILKKEVNTKCCLENGDG